MHTFAPHIVAHSFNSSAISYYVNERYFVFKLACYRRWLFIFIEIVFTIKCQQEKPLQKQRFFNGVRVYNEWILSGARPMWVVQILTASITLDKKKAQDIKQFTHGYYLEDGKYRRMFVMKKNQSDGEESASTSPLVKAASLVGYFVVLRVAFIAHQIATYKPE